MNRQVSYFSWIDDKSWKKYLNSSVINPTFVFDHKSWKLYIYIKVR